MNNELGYFINKQIIQKNTKLKYIITIPCVNREERNAINVIDRTFISFEKSGLFEQKDIDVSIALFESGSRDLSYLNFLDEYKKKYNIPIYIFFSGIQLNGITNTLRMFKFINKLPENQYDFVLWMDDDIYVCKNFIKNADTWIKNYANFSVFSSLYVPYVSYLIQNRKYVQLSLLPGFYGTCCTIFKPRLSKYVIPNWFNPHFEKFDYNPDTRFRDSVRHKFPNASKICVSSPSLVEHMNIGSSIKMKKVVNKGHKSKNFIGEENDPEFYLEE